MLKLQITCHAWPLAVGRVTMAVLSLKDAGRFCPLVAALGSDPDVSLGKKVKKKPRVLGKPRAESGREADLAVRKRVRQHIRGPGGGSEDLSWVLQAVPDNARGGGLVLPLKGSPPEKMAPRLGKSFNAQNRFILKGTLTPGSGVRYCPER
jgi:hypothetical protein